jgi:hypothetical protein
VNGEFVLDDKYVEGTKIRTHAPSSFLLGGNDHMGRIRVGTMKYNTRF